MLDECTTTISESGTLLGWFAEKIPYLLLISIEYSPYILIALFFLIVFSWLKSTQNLWQAIQTLKSYVFTTAKDILFFDKILLAKLLFICSAAVTIISMLARTEVNHDSLKIAFDASAIIVMFGLYYRLRSKYAKMTNLQAIVSVERSLAQLYDEKRKSTNKVTTQKQGNPFRFHGITSLDIKHAGLSGEELAYLVASFTAGRIYDMSHDTINRERFPEGHYRYKMLYQDSIRNAWPLIKKMMTHDEYVEKIDRTIQYIEKTIPHKCPGYKIGYLKVNDTIFEIYEETNVSGDEAKKRYCVTCDRLACRESLIFDSITEAIEKAIEVLPDATVVKREVRKLPHAKYIYNGGEHK